MDRENEKKSDEETVLDESEITEETSEHPLETSEQPESPKEQNEKVSDVDAFLSSLDEVTKQNEAENTDKPKKRKIKPWHIILTACLSVFIISLVLIGMNLYNGYLADKLHKDMNDDFFSGSDRTDLMGYLAPFVLDNAMPRYGSPRNSELSGDYKIIETNNPLHEQFKQKLLEYKKINSDIYGWIQVDGTSISYPLVKGADNDYYLDHTATNEYNTNGAIFADFRCKDDPLENGNLVFYGHNSTYLEQMFNQLTKFLDESFFYQNRYVTIYTVDGIYRYEIFSFYETHSTYKYCQTSFISNNSFVNWCNDMKDNSMYQVEMSDFNVNSRILTLSTCTNGYFTRRYSLQARLVLVEK